MTRRLLIAAALSLSSLAAVGYAADRGLWLSLDSSQLERVTASAPDLVVAVLELERLQLDAAAAGALLTGSIRTGASLALDARDADEGWSLDADALTISTRWNVVPYGPSFDATQRAERAVADAAASLHDLRVTVGLAIVEALDGLQRSRWGHELAYARVEYQRDLVDIAQHQVAIGTATAAAVLDAEYALAVAQEAALSALERLQSAERDVLLRFGLASSDLIATVGAPLETLPTFVRSLGSVSPLDVDDAVRDAAAGSDPRVRAAADALRAARDANAAATLLDDVTVSLSARAQTSGDLGRTSVSASWDTRTYQPTLDVTLGPWAPVQANTSLALSASVSIPFGGVATATEAMALAERLALERYRQALAAALRALDTAYLEDSQAQRALALALERFAQTDRRFEALALAAEDGAVAPTELERARLDRLDQALAVARAASDAEVARSALELRIGVPVSTPRIAAAVAAVTQEVP